MRVSHSECKNKVAASCTDDSLTLTRGIPLLSSRLSIVITKTVKVELITR